jgi:DUF1680 family protein
MPVPSDVQYGIVDTSRSPFAKLIPLGFGEIQLRGGFWAAWRNTTRREAIPYGYQKLVDSGALFNFEVAAGRRDGAFRNMRFSDSDLYKWLEAASYELANSWDDELASKVKACVDLAAEAQRSDGYLNTYYQLGDIEKRWTNLRHDHELYCAGHMFQAAVAHHRCTGDTSFLDVARRFADHIEEAFGPGKLESVPGHPEIEMALVELYRTTGEQRYFDLARFFVDYRGKGLIGGSPYHQDHCPVRECREMAGHAVRQLYLMSGMTDLYLENGESALLESLNRLWADMTTEKMSITGGVGARHDRESFGESYELPNDRVYNETCAQIASVMWNWRMLLATGQCRFADLMEWTLHNGVASGISLDGKSYFYPNPLMSRGAIERSGWFDCACCPPNVMRTLASMHNYFATRDGKGLQIHLYDSCEIETSLSQGGDIKIVMETEYPWKPDVKLTIQAASGTAENSEWTLSLRLPGWSGRPKIIVNGAEHAADATPGSYAEIRRAWSAGNTVELTFAMEPVFHEAHPYVEPARGCAALTRGPLVYCLEECDQNPGVKVMDCSIETDATPQISRRADLLAGVVTLEAQGFYESNEDWQGRLYRTVPSSSAKAASRTGTKLTAIPYYAWANRGTYPMAVWIPRS